MNREAISKLGVDFRAFELATFTDYLGERAGTTMFENAKRQTEAVGMQAKHLRVQVSVQTHMWNQLMFLISGPHGMQGRQRRVGYLALMYPERASPPDLGAWNDVAPGWAADQYWEHLEEPMSRMGEQ